jgi:hypothetical protein
VAGLSHFHAAFADTIEAGWRVVIHVPHPRVGMYMNVHLNLNLKLND